MGETITVKVRPSNGALFEVEIDPKCTVFQLKEKVGEKMDGTSASLLKLVYSGRILKDDDICSSHKLANGHTLHVVKSKGSSSSSSSPAPSTPAKSPDTAVKTSTAPESNTSATSRSTTTAAATTPNPPPTTTATRPTPRASPSPFPGMGSGDMSGMSGMPGMPQMNPEAMRQMMDSPMMQGLLNNTDFVRSIIMSNPQMRTLVEENPEIGHVINNPEFLRQSMEMMRNPELMREAQRSNDRALSNIEALPGGFNHLRRMYSTLQDPLDSATRPSDTSSDEANERLARQLNVTSVQENTRNTQALPNPWAAPSTTNNTSNTTNLNTNTSAPPNPFAALMSGAGAGSNASASPFAFPFMASPTSSNSSNSNTPSPFSTGGDQQQRTGSGLPFWADPNLAAQLQQSMMMGQQQQSQSGGGSNNNNNNGMPNMPFMANLWGGFNNNTPESTAPSQPLEPPETRFQSQIGQLEEMGFSEKQANIRALLATGGNVEAAIEYLLNL